QRRTARIAGERIEINHLPGIGREGVGVHRTGGFDGAGAGTGHVVGYRLAGRDGEALRQNGNDVEGVSAGSIDITINSDGVGAGRGQSLSSWIAIPACWRTGK